MFLLTGCGKSQENKFVNVEAKEDKIVIDTKDISNKVIYVNYKVDDTIIQFLVVKGSDGKVRIHVIPVIHHLMLIMFKKVITSFVKTVVINFI